MDYHNTTILFTHPDLLCTVRVRKESSVGRSDGPTDGQERGGSVVWPGHEVGLQEAPIEGFGAGRSVNGVTIYRATGVHLQLLLSKGLPVFLRPVEGGGGAGARPSPGGELSSGPRGH